MSELRSAIDQLRVQELSAQPDAMLEEDFAELVRAGELLEVERLRRLAELDRRRTYARDGFLSAAAWLASTFRTGWNWAREQVRVARGLDEMPLTRRALEDGDVSMSAVRVLVGAREADAEAFSQAEGLLVEAARNHSVRDLHRVAAHWRQLVEQERATAEGDSDGRRRRYLHASPTMDGVVRVDGELDPETGETLLVALRAVMDAEARSASEDARSADMRSPGQRRADALGEVCRGWLDGVDRPTVAGERPHVTMTLDVEGLLASAELDNTGPVGPDLARLLSCDASVTRVVMAGPSEPLDVGRRTPVVSPAMRRAVVVRDRACRFPGCARPQTWCDAHHVVHWADGGPTAVANLLLLCRRHHRLVHERGGFRLELEGDRPVFRRPDGSVLGDLWVSEERGPPVTV
jgi:hypothetical protein